MGRRSGSRQEGETGREGWVWATGLADGLDIQCEEKRGIKDVL